MKILLVDDDQDSRESVRDFLRELNHHVVECDNGDDALKSLHIDEFHMVLSDIKMPKMSGLELLHKTTALPRSEALDFVLFTGYGDMESAVQALRAGVYDYLLKPINIQELAALIERIEKKRIWLRKKKEIIKVLIISDQWIIRAGYKCLLDNANGFSLVGEAPGTEECLSEIEKTEPDVVIINCRDEKEKKIDMCSYINNNFPDIKIIISTCNHVCEYIAKCAEKGVAGFLLKKNTPNEILFLIKKVFEEGKYIDQAVTEILLKDGGGKGISNKFQVRGLTEQENKVLYGLALGKTNKEMAIELFLSPATIRNYVSNIIHKLDLPNRAAATAYAIKHLYFKKE